ncbi:MAG: hypothetical protein WBJ83_10850 [Thermacetogeniaceae bacterium]
MEEQTTKKPIWKRWWFWVCVVILLFIIIGSNSSKSSTPTQTQTAKQQTKKQFVWTTAEVTEDNIKAALAKNSPATPIVTDSDFPKSITKITIQDSTTKPGQKNIEITYKAGTAWDETDIVKRAGGTMIQAGSILFENPKIEQITLIALTEMTDQYGKTKLEEGTKITLNRETASKIDWKGLADRHTTDPGNIYRIADNYYIHPGIYKNVKPNEVRLL